MKIKKKSPVVMIFSFDLMINCDFMMIKLELSEIPSYRGRNPIADRYHPFKIGFTRINPLSPV
jgi:hypothetical protein